MGWESIAGAVGGGVLGGMAGGAGDKGNSTTASDYTQNLNLQDFKDLNRGQSGLEKNAYKQSVSSFADLSKLLGLGPGANEVQANTQYQNSFANQLQSMLQSLNNPSQADIAGNFSQAQQIFAPQQTALNQQFQDANTASNRLSARLGRAGNDPILRNKLAQEQTRQQTMLNSQIGSYGAQLPQQKAENLLNMGGALSNLRQGLATQAFSNRQTLLGMGQQLTAAERQYRIQTAQKTATNFSRTNSASGGGTGDVISGVMGGIGSFGSSLGGLFGTVGAGVGTGASQILPAVGGAAEIGGAAGVGSAAGVGTTAVAAAPVAAVAVV